VADLLFRRLREDASRKAGAAARPRELLEERAAGLGSVAHVAEKEEVMGRWGLYLALSTKVNAGIKGEA